MFCCPILDHVTVPQRTLFLKMSSFARACTCIIYEKIDCKTVGFFLKISKESVNRGVRVLHARSARASDLLFDCSRVLDYAKIWTVLESNEKTKGRIF